jgi:hypothetical protein
MKNIRERIKVLPFLAGLVLTTLATSSAFAASPAGGWGFTRIGAKGEYFAIMTDTSDTFCFLTDVKVEETDSPGESAECKISPQNGRWVLETILGKDGDAAVTCVARCYTNK